MDLVLGLYDGAIIIKSFMFVLELYCSVELFSYSSQKPSHSLVSELIKNIIPQLNLINNYHFEEKILPF